MKTIILLILTMSTAVIAADLNIKILEVSSGDHDIDGRNEFAFTATLKAASKTHVYAQRTVRNNMLLPNGKGGITTYHGLGPSYTIPERPILMGALDLKTLNINMSTDSFETFGNNEHLISYSIDLEKYKEEAGKAKDHTPENVEPRLYLNIEELDVLKPNEHISSSYLTLSDFRNQKVSFELEGEGTKFLVEVEFIE